MGYIYSTRILFLACFRQSIKTSWSAFHICMDGGGGVVGDARASCMHVRGVPSFPLPHTGRL